MDTLKEKNNWLIASREICKNRVTGVAQLAGVMIIPAVYVFSGLDGMSAGPGLMFISLPNVFYSMGNL